MSTEPTARQSAATGGTRSVVARTNPTFYLNPLRSALPRRSPDEVRIYQRTPWDAIEKHGTAAWKARMGEHSTAQQYAGQTGQLAVVGV